MSRGVLVEEFRKVRCNKWNVIRFSIVLAVFLWFINLNNKSSLHDTVLFLALELIHIFKINYATLTQITVHYDILDNDFCCYQRIEGIIGLV